MKSLYFIFILFFLIFVLSVKENFSKPKSKENFEQPEVETNLSDFKKLDQAFSIILDINGYRYNNKTTVCNGPKGCKKYNEIGYGFNPEEIEKYNENNSLDGLVKNGVVDNEKMIPFIVEAFKQCHKNIEEQNKTLKDIEDKLSKL